MFKESDFNDIDNLVDEGMAFVQETVDVATTKVSTVSSPINTAGVTISVADPRTPPTTTNVFDDDEDLTIAQTLVKMRSEKAKDKGVVIQDVEDPSRPVKSITTLRPLPTIDPKDKGKELAQRLHEEELAALERAQQEKQKQEEAIIATLVVEFDADYELAVKLTHEEQGKYSIEERARLLKNTLIEERNN
ncbi:hypothetical protein Tco_0780108 [Tanacetum coccineum]